jgi:hypothetical protein
MYPPQFLDWLKSIGRTDADAWCHSELVRAFGQGYVPTDAMSRLLTAGYSSAQWAAIHQYLSRLTRDAKKLKARPTLAPA